MIDWDSVSEDLKPDGALREIYILDASPENWRDVVSHVVAQADACEYSIDGIVQPEVPTADVALAVTTRATSSLRVIAGGIVFHCHFFSPDEIEFDFAPEDVDGPERLQTLLDFVSGLGRVTGKPVLVALEGGLEFPFLRYDPFQSTIEFLPP